MIRLIRLDGMEILLNADLIKFVEQTPDTVITLINGEKIIVKNTLKDVQEKVRAYRVGKNMEKVDAEKKTKKK